MCNFYLYLTLETVFQALKLTQTCYINMSLFLLKIGNLIINWLLLSYTQIMPKRLTAPLDKI